MQGAGGCADMQWRRDGDGYLKKVLTASVYDVAVSCNSFGALTSSEAPLATAMSAAMLMGAASLLAIAPIHSDCSRAHRTEIACQVSSGLEDAAVVHSWDRE